MSKKQQRIKYLVGLRNAINNPEYSEIVPGKTIEHTYNDDTVKSLLATIDYLLKEDGITPAKADSKAK